MNINNKKPALCIIIIALIAILFLGICIAINLSKKNNIFENTNSYSDTIKYINKEKYVDDKKHKRYRDVEYVGGIKININRPFGISKYELRYVGERWYPFYRDKNTGEILRGTENYNFVTVGTPYIGIDKMDVPNTRKTKNGFQEYVLKWTGSVLSRTNRFNSVDNGLYKNIKTYNGIYECNLHSYDMPIDLVADNLWGGEGEYQDGYDIYNIDDVKTKQYKQAIIYLSENEWVLNVLRNCFGFISDDFYELCNKNRINFDKIDISDVTIGDMGVYGNDKDGYNAGICIGYDNKFNPVFSISASANVFNIINETKKYAEISDGFNLIHVEKINNSANNIFNSFYKTNLPFESDKKEFKKDYIINDVDIYNKQIEFYINKNEYIKNNKNLNNTLIDERINRIGLRETKANELRSKYDINLNNYQNTDISKIYMINETNTYEFNMLFSTDEIKKDINELKRKTDKIYQKEVIENLKNYGEDFSDEQIDEAYRNCYEEIKELIINNKEKVKSISNDELREWFYSIGGTSELDLNLIKRFINENIDLLE